MWLTSFWLTGIGVYKIEHGETPIQRTEWLNRLWVGEYWCRISTAQNSPLPVYRLHGWLYVEVTLQLCPCLVIEIASPDKETWHLCTLTPVSSCRLPLTLLLLKSCLLWTITQMELSSILFFVSDSFHYSSLYRAHPHYGVYRYSDPFPCPWEIWKKTWKSSFWCSLGLYVR